MNSLPFTTYPQAIEYLSNLKTFGIRFGLEEFTLLLKNLNNPQEKLKFILVGGTNGKGSTSAILSAILKESGYRVGLYTSPHLERFTERIKINDEEIHKEDVVTLGNKIKNTINAIGSRFTIPHTPSLPPKVGGFYITFFEFVTAMAFVYFSEKKVDIAVFEVGMGGRLDATNIGSPIFSIITNISREHEEVLGKEVLEIAREKSGIVRKNSVLITGVIESQPLKLLREICKERDTELKVLGEDFATTLDTNKVFSYHGNSFRFKYLHTNLKGMHQRENASLALAALEVLREKESRVKEEAIRRGLKNVSWPGRLEIITTYLNRRVLLDCAHNPAGARTLQEFLLKEIYIDRLVMVLGIMRDKDIEGIVSILASLANHIIVTRPEEERSALLDTISQVVMRYNPRVEAIERVVDACHYGLSLLGERDLMCVTGSIFTVGEARRFLIEEY